MISGDDHIMLLKYSESVLLLGSDLRRRHSVNTRATSAGGTETYSGHRSS